MARANGLRNASLDDEMWIVSNIAHYPAEHIRLEADSADFLHLKTASRLC